MGIISVSDGRLLGISYDVIQKASEDLRIVPPIGFNDLPRTIKAKVRSHEEH